MPLTHEEARRLFSYDPETGVITNLVTRNRNGAMAGTVAGTIKPNKSGKLRHRAKWYRYVTVNRKSYLAHRFAWFWMTGKWPEFEVDHEDGDGLNNKWSNLRDATTKVNALNKRLLSNNTSGHAGVYWDKSRGQWVAHIKLNRRKRHLGRFDEIADAVAARKAAEHHHGFHPNHGSVRPL